MIVSRLVCLMVVAGAGFHSPAAAFGQAWSGSSTGGVEADCDTVGDGMLYGILPGILVGGLLIIFSGGEGPASTSIMISGSGALGALGGLLIDAANCNPADDPSLQTTSLQVKPRAQTGLFPDRFLSIMTQAHPYSTARSLIEGDSEVEIDD